MLFYIGEHTDLLPKIADKLYLDAGWQHQQDEQTHLYFKGYLNKGNLVDELPKIRSGEKPEGNWVVIEYHTELGFRKLHYPFPRPFPLYTSPQHKCRFTNIIQPESSHFDEVVPKVLSLPYPQEKISVTDAAHTVVEILKENISNYLKYNTGKPIMVNNGDASTVLVWAILNELTDDYFLHSPEPDLSFTHYLGDRPKDSVLHQCHSEYISPLLEHLRTYNKEYELLSVFEKPTTQIRCDYASSVLMHSHDHLHRLGLTVTIVAHALVRHNDYMAPLLDNFSQLKYARSSWLMYESPQAVHKFFDQWISQEFHKGHVDNNIVFDPYYDTRIHKTIRCIEETELLAEGINISLIRKMIDLVNPIFNKFVSDQYNTVYSFENFRMNKHLLPGIKDKLVPYLRN